MGCRTKATQKRSKKPTGQPGDIIIFENDKHIGIVSDKRNANGQPNREEDAIEHAPVTGHYRFDASRVDKKMLVRWE